MPMTHTPLYYNYLEELSAYSDAELGRLIRALLRYARDGVEPELRRREMLLWPLLRGNADRARESYEKLAQSRSLAGKKGAEALWGARDEERRGL